MVGLQPGQQGPGPEITAQDWRTAGELPRRAPGEAGPGVLDRCQSSPSGLARPGSPSSRLRGGPGNGVAHDRQPRCLAIPDCDSGSGCPRETAHPRTYPESGTRRRHTRWCSRRRSWDTLRLLPSVTQSTKPLSDAVPHEPCLRFPYARVALMIRGVTHRSDNSHRPGDRGQCVAYASQGGLRRRCIRNTTQPGSAASSPKGGGHRLDRPLPG